MKRSQNFSIFIGFGKKTEGIADYRNTLCNIFRTDYTLLTTVMIIGLRLVFLKR